MQTGTVPYNRFVELARNHQVSFSLMLAETERQIRHGVMIPSENHASEAVLAAIGTPLMNKYAEGYPGRRYYDGNDVAVDPLEERAIRATKVAFRGEHANVQPPTGAIANLATYNAVIDPGDTILSMSLPHGGHLSHGHDVTFVSRVYHIVQYGVRRDNERIDVDQFRNLAREHRPKVIVVGGSSYPLIPPYRDLAEIADEVGQQFGYRIFKVADIAHPAGLVAAGLHPNPVDWYDFLTFTSQKTSRGPRAGNIVVGKTANEEVTYMGNKLKLADALDRSVFPGMLGGPHQHTIFANLIALEEMLTPDLSKVSQRYFDYQNAVIRNARALADEFLRLSYRLVAGGTETHLLLLHEPGGFPGKIAAAVARKIGLSTNANSVPYDTRKPWNPSGLRMGTPALTTRGAKEVDMRIIAESLDDALRHTTVEGNVPIVPENVVLRNQEKIQKILESTPPLYENLYKEMLEAAKIAGIR